MESLVEALTWGIILTSMLLGTETGPCTIEHAVLNFQISPFTILYLTIDFEYFLILELASTSLHFLALMMSLSDIQT